MATYTTTTGNFNYDGDFDLFQFYAEAASGTNLDQAVADDIIVLDGLSMNLNVENHLDTAIGTGTYHFGDISEDKGGYTDLYSIVATGGITVTQAIYDGIDNLKLKVTSVSQFGDIIVEQIPPISHDKALGYDSVAFLKDKIENAYTAGTNVSISSGVISATDTTYSNFTGTDGVDPGTAGLVPAPTTSDTDKYLKSDGTWATVSGGGGGGGTLYPGTGTNTDGAMTQKATTDMVFNSNTKSRIQIGSSASANANNSIAIGASTAVNSNQNCVALGASAKVTGSSHPYATSLGSQASCAYSYSVALGSYATPRAQGVVDVSTGNGANGYQGTGEATRSKLRVISGVHDGENDNDAMTVGQVKTLAYKLVTVDPQLNNTPADFIGQIAIYYEEPVTGVKQLRSRFMCTVIDTSQSQPYYGWQSF